MAILKERRVAFRLDVLGADTLAGEIQERARRLGLVEAVHFHGLVPFQDLAPWYQRADLLVVSSRHEAGPLALLEAALSGVPTVGTRVGHIADLAPEAAVAVAVGDSAGLAQAIEALAGDEPRRLRLAHAAHAFAKEHDADFTCARVEAVYKKVVRRA